MTKFDVIFAIVGAFLLGAGFGIWCGITAVQDSVAAAYSAALLDLFDRKHK